MRIALVEDSTLLRAGLEQLLLAEGHQITVSVGEAVTLLHRLPDDQPDVVVLDVRLPPTFTDEGVRAALTIREQWPAVGVLVLSQYVERHHTRQLIMNSEGGVGYLLKDRVAGVTEFLDALIRVHDGGTAFDPEIVRQLLRPSATTNRLSVLSAREREVLALIAEGFTNQTIAGRLHLSLSAVEKHASAIFERLGLNADRGYSPRSLAVITHLQESAGDGS
ncbi:LuxR C-terminal-related transcriptional regulator [Propionibacteriaceae bacterium Y1700]|uniref:LuxR C-terminal-related transcriptional regulator n=1 Tax=Microlunatus sp. Y1700 TaxID=3418487 RepID=UPI003DA769B9